MLQTLLVFMIDASIADFDYDLLVIMLELDGPVHDIRVEYDTHLDQVIASPGCMVIRNANVGIDLERSAVQSEC